MLDMFVLADCGNLKNNKRSVDNRNLTILGF